MSQFEPARYGSAFASLLVTDELNELGPGTPDRAAARRLKELTAAAAFAPHKVVDDEMAEACLSGVWLLHDCLDESHTISQSIESPTGAYWHGIMHRREPDFSNSKYWFRRVGRHPVFELLCAAARELAARSADPAAAFLREQSAWDPFRFVDLCESAQSGRAKSDELCRQVQRREWELLFDFCYQRAIAQASDG